jgi:antitoxin HicB
MNKTLEYYLNLPYTFELRHTPDEDWFVRVKELPGCMSQGDTPEEAMQMIRDAMRSWLEVSLECGDPIPEPVERKDEFSGKFIVRVPRSLHRKLVEEADAEGVSLNSYIQCALAEKVGEQAKKPKKTPTLGISAQGHWINESNAVESHDGPEVAG